MSGFIFFMAGVLTLAAFYAILAMVLNMVAGWAGMWDLGVAGLVGVGAYTYVLMTQTSSVNGEVAFAPSLPIPVGILIAAAVTGITAFLIGLPTLRLRGEYFLITTLAFAEVVRQVLNNARGITRGPSGFSGIDRPFQDLFTGSGYRLFLLLLTVLAAAIVYALMRRISRAPFGYLLRAMRDNEAVAISLGKAITRHRRVTFIFAGVIIGAATPLYVWHIRGIVPHMFGSDVTFAVWTALVIGGIGSRLGPVLGALALVLLTETISFIQVSAEYAQLLASARPVILGVLLILIMRLRPAGLITERYTFRKPTVASGGPVEHVSRVTTGEGAPL